jgi:serine/threonine protein phosphatase PrpC
MPQHVELEHAARTDTGKIRSCNEDAIALSEAHGLAILADGMGGYNAGEVASGIAVTELRGTIEQQLRDHRRYRGAGSGKQLQSLLADGFERANQAILQAARHEPAYRGMGTTMVAALYQHDLAVIAHIGDSRAYRWRHGVLSQLTRDHSMLQEQLDAGLIDAASARVSPHRNLVTRALGVDPRIAVELGEHQTMAGDIYLLCSDGLTDMLDDDDIADMLSRADAGLDAACEALVAGANAHGGHDNISVILTRIVQCSADAGNPLQRLLDWMR